jgi:hypothetical protein
MWISTCEASQATNEETNRQHGGGVQQREEKELRAFAVGRKRIRQEMRTAAIDRDYVQQRKNEKQRKTEKKLVE